MLLQIGKGDGIFFHEQQKDCSIIPTRRHLTLIDYSCIGIPREARKDNSDAAAPETYSSDGTGLYVSVDSPTFRHTLFEFAGSFTNLAAMLFLDEITNTPTGRFT
jgi:hypothetical protein